MYSWIQLETAEKSQVICTQLVAKRRFITVHQNFFKTACSEGRLWDWSLLLLSAWWKSHEVRSWCLNGKHPSTERVSEWQKLPVQASHSINKQRLIRTWHGKILNCVVKHPNKKNSSKIKRRGQRGTCNLLVRVQCYKIKAMTTKTAPETTGTDTRF